MNPLKARVRVSRKARNATGWHLVLGKPGNCVWFRSKPAAITALRHALNTLVFEVKPAPKRQRQQPTFSNWFTKG